MVTKTKAAGLANAELRHTSDGPETPVGWRNVVARRSCASELAPSALGVPEAITGPGAPLDPVVRSRMEQQIGHDFSTVRVHTEPVAAESAHALGALAYTVGRDVVFASGRYEPHTPTGELLLAHELGHVAEQRGIGTQLLRQPANRQIIQPSRADLRRAVEDAIHFLEMAAGHYGLRGPISTTNRRVAPPAQVSLGRLRTILAGWLRVRDTASRLVTGLGSDRHLAGDLQTAYRNAIRAVIVAASSQARRASGAGERPTEADLYRQHQEVIHEWAWPGARLAQGRNDLLGTLSDAEQSVVRVEIDELDLSDAASWFRPNVRDVPKPPRLEVVVSPNIPAPLQRGLTNVALDLVTRNVLAVNRTTTVALDLRARRGGHHTYRITHVRRRAGRGQRARRDVLVERLGAVGLERDRTRQQPGGLERFRRHGFVRGDGWSDPQFAQLLAALAGIPESMLAEIAGITFIQVPTIPSETEAAEYRIEDHSIRVADSAFQGGVSHRRFHGPEGLATGFERLIAHEIGHAIDLASLRGPLAAFNQAAAARNRFLEQHGARIQGRRFRIPSDQQQAFDVVRRAEGAARRTLEARRGESGARYVRGRGRAERPTDNLPRGEANEFREAARRDGRIRVTTYSDRNWREYYAESFSLYVTDPETLARLRPHVYDYFARRPPSAARPVR